jgi:glycosyltransferase involved in cell wall biosynthesis
MVGRIEPWKGQHVYLEAVRLLPKELRERHVFALVGGAVPGRDDYYRKVEGEAASLGVLMLGERADVPALLRAADISVHASTEPDPFPGVVIESLLAGAATVAARAGGVPEMVTHEDDGLLTNPGDPQELAVALKQLLLMDEVKLRGLGERGRTHALRLVDSSYVDEQLADLYRSLCPSPRSSLTPRAQ